MENDAAKKPNDYVISTGKTYNIKYFINLATKYLGLKTKWTGKGLNEKLINLANKKVINKINPKLFRPAEVNILRGNSSLARKIKLVSENKFEKFSKNYD